MLEKQMSKIYSRLAPFLRRFARAELIAIVWLALVTLSAAAQAGQVGGGWTPQKRIPNFGDESRAPYLIADQDGKIYAFNTQPDGPGIAAIFVREWSVQQSWSPPVDIMLSPLGGSPTVDGVSLDSSGIIHLTFFAGNESYGAVYYTWAPAYLADQPQAWAEPVLIGDDALDLGTAFTGDSSSNLFLIFSGRHDGVGLYSVLSEDNGKSWSTAKLITLMQDATLQPNGTQLLADAQGRLHVVWSEVDQTGIDQVVYYDRLEANHKDWSQPYILARKDPGDYKAAWPSILAYRGGLMVVYQDSNPGTRWMRQSTDGGQTWSDPVHPWPHVGEYGKSVLLVDSSDTLHVILGNRNGECCHGMWHGTWLGDHWGPLEPIVMGPKTPQFDPSGPQAIISQGNVIMATWWTDTGGGPRNGAWYSYTVLNVSELPHKPLPQPKPESAFQAPPVFGSVPRPAAPTQTPMPTEIPVSQLGKTFNQRPPSDNPVLPVLAGLLPVSLIIIGLLVFLQNKTIHR